MIGNNYSLSTRDAWTMVIGHKCHMTVNANNKITQIDYYDNNVIVFSQVLTYDANGNMIEIECVAPSN